MLVGEFVMLRNAEPQLGEISSESENSLNRGLSITHKLRPEGDAGN
jgi:hypothetical protein